MSVFKNRVDFMSICAVYDANPNGDPLFDNRPRTDFIGLGEISPECCKRKLKNRAQDLGMPIYHQMEDRVDDGFANLYDRAVNAGLKDIKDANEYYKKVCGIWYDVRAFGGVFANKDFKLPSVGVRGAVTVCNTKSVDIVDVASYQITKSASAQKGTNEGRDTMGMRHFVRFGVYKIMGSINPQIASKTGFTEEDAEVLKESLRTMCINDESAARPAGSMEVVKLIWC